jgi:diadenosine tetraphosphatase ApaH/serine/threonine PP2A family protein phosphatase
MSYEKHLFELESGRDLSESDIIDILTQLPEVLFQENTLLEIPAPAIICGDIHGQLPDLLELFAVSGSPYHHRYVFMGDYVDRGEYSLRTFIYLALLKIKYPVNVYLLRGNHECRTVTTHYGFQKEIQDRFGHLGIWHLTTETFDLLPLAAVIGRGVFAVHGGLSPNLMRLEGFAGLDRDCEIPAEGPITDLTWSDPDEDATVWRPNARGAGQVFGGPQVAEFCRINGDLSLVTRSHQWVGDGIRWCFDGKLATVWSAPNYYRRNDLKNPGMVLKWEAPHVCETVRFEARPTNRLWNVRR